MKTKTKLILLPFILMMASCQETKPSEGGKESLKDSSDPSSQVSENGLGSALSKAKKEELTLKGTETHEYTFPSPVAENNDNNKVSSVTVSFGKDDWSLTTLDQGEGNVPVTKSYFKNDEGILCKEYLKYDNTIGLTPILDKGSTSLFDIQFGNPFSGLSEEDFAKEDDSYFLNGEKASMFVYHLFNETVSGGKIGFKVQNGSFLSLTGEGFTNDDYLYTSDDTIKRHVGLSFDLAVASFEPVAHLSAENAKHYTELNSFFSAAKNGKFRISNGASADNRGFSIYFDGTSIFATFSPEETEAGDFDFLLKPDDKGILQLKYYDSSSKTWIDNSYEDTQRYKTPTTYDVLCPKIGDISGNIFVRSGLNDTNYSPAEDALPYIGENFYSRLYEYLGLSARECFRSHLSTFDRTLKDGVRDIHAKALAQGSGYTFTAENYLKIDQVGTCALPFGL